VTFDLTGQLLIAMPKVSETIFSNSLLFMCAHNCDGAMGIVINKPLQTNLKAVLAQLNIDSSSCPMNNACMYYGGPVSTDRVFVLHRPSKKWASTASITTDVSLSTSLDILEDISQDKGPSEVLISVGHAGWKPGQLEDEFRENAWLSVPCNPELIFNVSAGEKVSGAIETLGIQNGTLSEYCGQA